MPFPSDETTPPVTKIYLAMTFRALHGSFEQLRYALQIGRRIDAQGFVLGCDHTYAVPVLERSQLLEALGFFQRPHRQAGVAKQEVALIDVEADVLEVHGAAVRNR